MKRQVKLTERQQSVEAQQTQAEGVREFATVEAMLRHDAVHTPVPPAIGRRLGESIARLGPPPRRAWWRRWFKPS
jgi:hypothetical protein